MHRRDDESARAPRIRTRITGESLDGLAEFETLASPAEGAVSIFQGRVRETNEGREVAALTYEAYGEMAERELAAICEEAGRSFAVGAISAAHRVGRLALGEASVAVGVAAAHRDEAYRASRWILEEIKARLPIWKHEHLTDGTSVWVGAPAVPAAAPEDGEAGTP